MGSPPPQMPTWADPLASMTRLATPACRGTITRESSSNPPEPELVLNPPLNAATSAGASSGPIAGPLSDPMVLAGTGGSVLPAWRANRAGVARTRKTGTTWPSASVTAWLSTAIAPPTVDTGVHPGCSVVVVVVGGTVVEGGVRLVFRVVEGLVVDFG